MPTTKLWMLDKDNRPQEVEFGGGGNTSAIGRISKPTAIIANDTAVVPLHDPLGRQVVHTGTVDPADFFYLASYITVVAGTAQNLVAISSNRRLWITYLQVNPYTQISKGTVEIKQGNSATTYRRIATINSCRSGNADLAVAETHSISFGPVGIPLDKQATSFITAVNAQLFNTDPVALDLVIYGYYTDW